MKKIIVQRIDGGLSIVIPTHEATSETMLRDALRVPGYVLHKEIDDSDIPEDRTFREAWRLVDGKIVVDEQIAKKFNLKTI